MKRTTRAEKIEQIQRAAFMFARVTRDANEIAAALRVSSRTVQRMIHLPLFQEELDRLGYQGERRFRKSHRAPRSAERTRQPEYQKVRQLWHQMTDTLSREGHCGPGGHQSQLQHRPPLVSRLAAEMTIPITLS